MTLAEMLSSLVEEFGRDLLRERGRVLGLVADRYPAAKREQRLLKVAYEAGVVEDLLRDVGEHAQRRAVTKLEEEFSLDASVVAEVVNTLVAILSIGTDPTTFETTIFIASPKHRKPKRRGGNRSTTLEPSIVVQEREPERVDEVTSPTTDETRVVAPRVPWLKVGGVLLLIAMGGGLLWFAGFLSSFDGVNASSKVEPKPSKRIEAPQQTPPLPAVSKTQIQPYLDAAKEAFKRRDWTSMQSHLKQASQMDAKGAARFRREQAEVFVEVARLKRKKNEPDAAEVALDEATRWDPKWVAEVRQQPNIR